jgi:hypothetical protein
MTPNAETLNLLKTIASYVDAAESLDEAKQLVNASIMEYCKWLEESFHGKS